MPVEPIQEPPGIVIPVEESVLKAIQTELKALRTGMASQFEKLNERIDGLEKAHGDSGHEYRVLRDAIDHARVISLRVEKRLDNMDEMEKLRAPRAKIDTIPGPGDESPTNPASRSP